jgi:hypothetical protein
MIRIGQQTVPVGVAKASAHRQRASRVKFHPGSVPCGAASRMLKQTRWGMNLSNFEFDRQSNPVDMIEFVAAANDWTFERSGEHEIAMTVEGHWTDYHVSFSWMEDCEALHIASAFDIKVPDVRVTEVMRLLSHVNGQVLMGHFDLWQQESVIIFRQSLLLAGGAEPTNRQVEVLLSNALDSCEAYFQAFQFVVWSGMDARSAIEAVMFETRGEA